jgi:carboxypeptidase Taq
VRVVRRDYDKNLLIPTDLKVAFSQAQSEGYMTWVEARQASDFSMLQPVLERIVALHREAIALVRAADDSFAEGYDVLVDDYEPGLESTEIARVFDELKAATIPLVARVTERSDLVSRCSRPWRLSGCCARSIGSPHGRAIGIQGRCLALDVTQHPFATSIALDDIRITTRYDADFLNPACLAPCMSSAMDSMRSRWGRASSERRWQAVRRWPFHESQSRMWENLIGRGRPFWIWGLPQLKSSYPDRFADVTEDSLYRAINKLGPSFIRVEADELTYNLHIILRSKSNATFFRQARGCRLARCLERAVRFLLRTAGSP